MQHVSSCVEEVEGLCNLKETIVCLYWVKLIFLEKEISKKDEKNK